MVFAQLLLNILGFGMFICLIIVLIKLFQAEGVGKGILGLICGLYSFIWGWKNKDQHNLQTVMTIWTILLAIVGVLAVIAVLNTEGFI